MAKKKLTVSQFVELVTEAFTKYQDVTGAILEDYVADDGMITELAAADINFIEEVEKMEVEDFGDFDKVIEALETHEVYSDTKKTKQILQALDEDTIREFANGEGGFILIKVEDMNKRDQIEEFIKEKIYPSYNEQQANLFL